MEPSFAGLQSYHALRMDQLHVPRDDMEHPSDRIGRGRFQLMNGCRKTIGRAPLNHPGTRNQSGWYTEAPGEYEQYVIEIEQQTRTIANALHPDPARAASRRAMNEMRKTVEIADGSADFPALMVAEYGEGILRSWKYARNVFKEATGLRLKPDEEGN